MLCHQYSKFHLEIQQTRRVGVWGLTKKNFTENSTDREQLGFRAPTKNFTEKFNRQGKLGSGLTKEFHENSTDRASWGSMVD